MTDKVSKIGWFGSRYIEKVQDTLIFICYKNANKTNGIGIEGKARKNLAIFLSYVLPNNNLL